MFVFSKGTPKTFNAIRVACKTKGSDTKKMAKLNNRNYIGIEIAEDYCKTAEERLL
jgi:DNA modification methylase